MLQNVTLNVSEKPKLIVISCLLQVPPFKVKRDDSFVCFLACCLTNSFFLYCSLCFWAFCYSWILLWNNNKIKLTLFKKNADPCFELKWFIGRTYWNQLSQRFLVSRSHITTRPPQVSCRTSPQILPACPLASIPPFKVVSNFCWRTKMMSLLDFRFFSWLIFIFVWSCDSQGSKERKEICLMHQLPRAAMC